jgi:hypothetical protein
MPGMGGMGGMPGGRNVPRKGRSVEQEYEVSLEELYKGKTTKFSNTKNVVCSVCKGSGGKQGAKSHSCGVCNGRGMFSRITTSYYKVLTQCRCESSTSTSWPRPRHPRNRTLRQLSRIWPSHTREEPMQEVQGQDGCRVEKCPRTLYPTRRTRRRADYTCRRSRSITGSGSWRHHLYA